jgi:hypothetical protein
MALAIIDANASSNTVTETLSSTADFEDLFYIRQDEQNEDDFGLVYNIHGEVNSTNAYLLYLKQLASRNVFLKKEIELIVDMEDDGYILSNSTLNVHAFGETFSEALEEWEFILLNIYASYINTPDDQLTPGGKNLKDRLQDYVEVINAH